MNGGMVLLATIGGFLMHQFDAAWYQYLALGLAFAGDWCLLSAHIARKQQASAQLRADLANELARLRESLAEIEAKVDNL
jgi:hypothetical protein